MKTFFFLIIFLLLIFSCSQKKELNEDYQAIAICNYYNFMISKDQSIHLPKIEKIIFYYHDTLFQFESNRFDTIYSYIKTKKESHILLKKEIRKIEKVNIQEIEKYRNEMSENGVLYCGPDVYLHSKKKNKYLFTLFSIKQISDWFDYNWTRKTIIKKKEFPQKFHEIYHTINSYQLNFHFQGNNNILTKYLN